MKVQSLNVFIILSAFCLAFAVNVLRADELKINAGFWPGDLDPELEERFFLDDLLASGSLGQIDLEWDNKDTQTIYPLGLEYIKPNLGPGDLVLRGNYMRYAPDYHYNAFTLGGAITDTTLVDYSIDDYEYEMGYRFHLLSNTLLVTPKAGYRIHNKSFNMDEITVGSGTITKSIDSYYDASTSGYYMGLDLQFFINNEFSIVGTYVGGSAAWSGDASLTKLKLGISSGAATLTYEQATSGYELSVERYSLGVQYDLGTDWHFQIGLREEKLTQSYPGFYNLSFTNIGGFSGFDPTEFLTDMNIYEQEITQTKGLVYMAITYDINL